MASQSVMRPAGDVIDFTGADIREFQRTLLLLRVLLFLSKLLIDIIKSLKTGAPFIFLVNVHSHNLFTLLNFCVLQITSEKNILSKMISIHVYGETQTL